MKLWAMLCRATQDGRVMVESSDKMWSTREGNGKPLQHSCLENPMNSMKRQNDRILKEELPRSVGAPYATADQWRNNSRKNEGMEPKQKQHPLVDVTGDRSKVWCCKEQYCIGTWNVRSMNQDKLEVVKQEMVRVNVNILGISELKWTGLEEKGQNHPQEKEMQKSNIAVWGGLTKYLWKEEKQKAKEKRKDIHIWMQSFKE